MAFTPIETQEAFDEAIKSRIERATQKAAAEAAKKFEGYISPDDLTAKTADLTKEIESLKGQLGERDKSIADLTSENENYKLKHERTKAAAAHGIPLDLADRLSGSTAEELAADAEKLSQFLKPASAPPLMSVDRVPSGKKPEESVTDAALLSALESISS